MASSPRGGGGPGGRKRNAPRRTEFPFVSWSQPPNMKQRGLIFDSLSKIVAAKPNKMLRGRENSDTRGTCAFTWGAGYHGQLGRKFVRGQKKYSAVPLMIDLDVVIRQVSCGGLHTAAVTESGQVYTWGDGRNGELGHAHDPSLKQTPRLVDALDTVFVMHVACGGSHTLATTGAGVVYSWGLAKFGQLGHGDRTSMRYPKRIEHADARNISFVAAGNKHSVILSKSGSVFSFGCGEHGQTGLGDAAERMVPTRIEVMAKHKVTAVSCGNIHSCVVTSDGEVYLFGFGENFHPDDSQHFFYIPTLIPMPEPMKSVACGQSHNLALSEKGNVYAWGGGAYGQIGHGVKGNCANPRLVLLNKNIMQIAAGRYHSVALNNRGALYSWGCGENGQLGLGNDENVAIPTFVPTIIGTVVGQISCGEHHTAVLTSAPWTKVGSGLHDWVLKERTELDKKERLVKRTHRGLTAKDLGRIREEMRTWQAHYVKRKKELEEEEADETKVDLENIQWRAQLEEIVDRSLADAKARIQAREDGRLEDGDASLEQTRELIPPKLPVVGESDTAGDDGAAGQVSGTVTKLPKLPGLALLQQRHAQTTRTHRKRADSLEETVRADGRQAPGSARPSVTDMRVQGQAPFARSAFLKETASMVKRMTNVVTDRGEANSEKSLSRILRQTFAYRKDYDSLRHYSRSRARLLVGLKKELKLLEESTQSALTTNDEANERLDRLRMQLSTVSIKIAETMENRQNYELNIAHLKEEDFEHFNQLKELRKQNSENNAFYKKMNNLRLQAFEEKEKSQQELIDFKKEIEEYQRFVKYQLGQFANIRDIVRAQNEKRAKVKSLRTEKDQTKIASRIERLASDAAAADKEASGLTARLTSLDLKLRHFEDSFQKISAATGLTDPAAIVNKFFFKGEIKEQLQQEIDDKQQLIADMRANEKRLKVQLEELKEHYKDHTWRDVEQLSSVHHDNEVRAKKAEERHQRLLQRLVLVKEGLLELLIRVERSHGKSGATHVSQDSSWTVEESTDIFSRLDRTVGELMRSVVELEEQNAKRRERIEAEKTAMRSKKLHPFGLNPLEVHELKERRRNEIQEMLEAEKQNTYAEEQNEMGFMVEPNVA